MHEPPPRHRHRHRHRHRISPPATVVLVGALASTALYLHGASWWAVPAIPAVAHVVLAGAALLVGHLATGGRGQASATTPEAPEGTFIRRARLYDWLVRILLLGDERRFRTGILDAASIQPGDAVLDVGCGTGTLLLMAAARTGPDGRLAGVEPSAPMRDRAREKAAHAGVRIELPDASARQLPYPAQSFDVVFCTLVLHHLPDSGRREALAEMRRVLRPGGRLVIAELGAPRGFAGVFSLVSLFHGNVEGRDRLIADTLREVEALEFADVAVRATTASAVSILVARVAPATDRGTVGTP